MKNKLFPSYLSALFLLFLFGTSLFGVPNKESGREVAAVDWTFTASDTNKNEPTVIPKQTNNPLNTDPSSPFYLKNPSNQKTEIVYDPVTNTYVFQNKIGDMNNGPAGRMPLSDYRDYDIQKAMNEYWRQRAATSTSGQNTRGLIPEIRIPGDAFETLFGSSLVDIRSTGSLELIFKVVHNKTDNPNIIERNQKQTYFDFDANIQLNLKAKIGDKIGFDLNYNTLAQFNFENKFKLRYEGKEDEIFKLLEFGNITMPLNNRLIQGSQTLFGAKAQMQFGKLMLTTVVSQQEGNRKTISIQGGSELNEFEFRADDYEEDKHYFIAQYFYENYNNALSTLPLVNSKINITRIEVWRTNIGSAVHENRNIIAVSDLGEPNPYNKNIKRTSMRNYPDSSANDFLKGINYAQMRDLNSAFSYLSTYRGGMSPGIDFEKVESARLLSPTEYTFNSKLGFISLTNKLTPGQVLAVAFQYTVLGDPNVYQVGQFSNEVETPNCLVVKLLNATTVNTQIPMWKLMMKNVYSLNIYQFSPEEFRLNVLYNNGVAMGYFPDAAGDLKSTPLIRLLGADRLNQQLDNYSDGLFDYLDNAATDGGTVQASTGKIYWPLVEPFGKDLRAALAADPVAADKYAFDSLYSLPKVLAQQNPDRNKFYLEGRYKSSMGSMINLGMANLAEGSVIVTAGGITLQEHTDYTVDYNMGQLRITNPSYMQSGTPITISLESKNLFGQKKTMFGLNAEYSFSKNFVVGATILNLRERTPEGLTKVKFGYEPINNTIWGMNLAYQTNSRWITRMLNYLPFYKSTTDSKIQLNGEFAHFIPGHPRIIGKGDKAELYVDDFEAAISTFYLGTMSMWKMASIPQHQTQRDMFPEGAPNMGLASGYNRAILSWYNIDPILHHKSDAPRISNGSINADALSEMYARRINIDEVFPRRPVLTNNGEDPTLTTLDLAFYPNQRGSYNFDALGMSGISAGLDFDGTLKNPASRWGGIMRRMENPDFESNNIEYVQFWMLDPFLDNPNSSGGKLYINLGHISEDILRDGRKSYENGFAADGSDDGAEYTIWGRVPINQPIVVAFDNTQSRKYQDIGLDGLYDELERRHYADYLQTIQGIVDPAVYQSFYDDPSADNYHFYRGADYNDQKLGIVARYKKYCNTEGNSVSDEDRSADAKANGYIEQATSRPDIEDINNDNTMSEDEQYYQYEMDIRPSTLAIGKNYITDMQETDIRLENGTTRHVKWYQFKVPVRSPDKTVGGITGFSSIRFMRLFLKGFSDSLVFRMAEMTLVRGDWRQYTKDLREDGAYPSGGGNETSFYVSTLSVQENGKRDPIPYVMPAGVRKQYAYTMQSERELNEQSLTMRAINLADGDARAVYKNTMFDFRRFGTLKFYLHGEKVFEEDNDEDLAKDVKFFIRLGTDFTENYYEYETSIDLTPWWTTDSALIWKQSNYVTVDLQRMVDVKQQRNYDERHGMPFPPGQRYTDTTADPVTQKINNIYVIGNPSLDNVRIIMMGVRNPRKKKIDDDDDMLPKSIEVWVNELRLSNFEEKGGWAALGNVRIDLADLGDVSLAAGISTPGFGALESSTYDRQMYTQTTLDFATNIQIGKMLPTKWEINIPIHYDLSRKVESPEYNPLNADVRLKEDLKTYLPEDRQKIKEQAVDFIQRQNVNVLNARKNKSPKAKNWVWNISNFDFSYAYTEMKSYNIDMEYNNLFTHRGGIGYAFGCNPKKIQPFKKIEKIKNKSAKQWLQLLSDFNFHLYPKSYSFRTEVYRSFGEAMIRNVSKGLIIMEPSYAKIFEWSRDYAVSWDLATSLKVDYTASAMAFITEPQGKIDTKVKKDSIWHSFGELGKMNNFQQSLNVNYQIPINKIPIFSFITSSVRYQSTYMWMAAPPAIDYIGNQIENSNTKQFNATANFINLYNKSKYLKKVQQGNFGSSLKDNPILKKKQQEKVDYSKLGLTRQQQDSARKADEANTPKNYGKEILDNFLRLTMILKNVSFAYTEGCGTSMPGYMLQPDLFGLTFNKFAAPGPLFVFGIQDENIRYIASQNGWLTTSDLLNTPYSQQKNQNLSAKVALEPLKSFKIDLTATRTNSTSDILYYIPDSNGVYRDDMRQKTGTFTISTICAGTLFAKDIKVKEDYVNKNFEKFKDNRIKIANRLANNREEVRKGYDASIRDDDGFPDGYGRLDQEVLLYAFLAAYSGKDPSSSPIGTPLTKIPLPNWRISYNGLSKVPGIDKVFQSINIQHGYTCMYQLGGYGTNVKFDPLQGDFQDLRDALNNFIPAIEAGAVSITESMNPIIGFDMTMKNSLQFKAEWRKTRNVTLSMANFQVSEMSNDELVFGTGYRFKNLKITFDFAGAQHQTDGDLTLRVDFSIRDNKTLLRKIEEDINQPSNGQRILSIAVYGEYQITKDFSGKVFYNHTLNSPLLSTQYKNLSIEAGISLKIILN